MSILKIKLKNCKKIIDSKGELYVSELNKLFKFSIKRIFFFFGKKNNTRGKHAHKTCTQIIFLISGSVEIMISDGSNSKRILLNKLGQYVVIYKKIWSEQKFLTVNSKILVCCDKAYDKKDYIYNLKELSR